IHARSADGSAGTMASSEFDHSRTTRSRPAEAIHAPSGENATDSTGAEWRWMATHTPVATSPTLSVWSQEHVTSRLPSGEKASERGVSVWPESTRLVPRATSQSRAV